ncbi:MAG TPA: hypothetical protein VD866_32060 [Urbifossiella sp.]|nr:hypothetical protein [Urbifossiella sp.]
MTHADPTVEAARASARRAGKVAPVLAPAPPVSAVARASGAGPATRGVGSHLKLILNALGLGESASCGCASMRARMDGWGPAGCRQHRAEIEAHLRNEAREIGWVAKLRAGAAAVGQGLFFSPIDPAPGLLDEAIRRAATDPPPAPPPPPPPAAKADPWAEPVFVPAPPAFAGAGGRLALVTVAAGEKGRRLLKVSGPLMERYARRIGATFIVLDWPGPDGWPMGSKFALGPVVAAHDRTIYADADVEFTDESVNLAEQVPHDAVGGVSDWWAVARMYPPFHAEYHRFLAFMGLDAVDPVPWYLNTGLLILPRSVAPLLMPPTRPIPPLWCSEQHWWNARIHAAGVPVHVLPPRCNFQWWAHEPEFWQTAPRKPGGFTPPADAVLHFSGPTDTDRKLALMRQWAPAELPPEPEPPAPELPEAEPEPPAEVPRVIPPSDGPAPCGPPPASRFALRRGLTREVLIVGRWVVKVPSLRGWRPFLAGILANLTESARSGLDPRLCPVRWCAPGGLLLVQRRAAPLTPAAAAQIGPDFGRLPTGGPWPRVPPPDLDPADPLSWRNYGEIDGRPVIVDYGW